MKKYIFIIFATVLLSSCEKEQCWVVMDCLGNDISGFCGTEQEVKDHCQANSTPGCQWNYKPG